MIISLVGFPSEIKALAFKDGIKLIGPPLQLKGKFHTKGREDLTLMNTLN